MASPTTTNIDPWIVQVHERARYQQQFDSLKPINGMITGAQAKEFFLKSQLPPLILGQIWGLSDIDSDGKMNINEFSIACKLINLKLRGYEIPSSLPTPLEKSIQSFSMASASSAPMQTMSAVVSVSGISQPVGALKSVPITTPVAIPKIDPPTSHFTQPVVISSMSAVPSESISTVPAPVLNMSQPLSRSISSLSTTELVSAVLPLTIANQDVSPESRTVPGFIPTITPPITPISTSSMNGSIIHTPVSTSTPVSTTAVISSIDRVGSVDSVYSQHSVGSSQPIEWNVPHQTKLKYTQLFNTWDRTRSGFLSGPQARNILIQTQLPQAVLAQIWTLADMDSDGRLGCEEFVLAMHLCDLAKAGEVIPSVLPVELIPPTFQRQRQCSISSQGVNDNADPLAGMPQSSFEDKRKENFDKGQAELERRRKALLEVQRKEQEERERKEREEAEKREKIRLEQEKRRQAEIEQQMLRQKEVEEQKEEERKRVQEQREAARKEMERQRQLEWEKQKLQELQAQRLKEQDILLKHKAKNQSLTIELTSLNDRVKELSQKICDTRVGVSTVKTTIDGMRTTRDHQLQQMALLKNKLREQNQRLLACSQEKARIEAKTKALEAAGQEAQKLALTNKQIALKQMQDKLIDLEQEIKEKEKEVNNSKKHLEEINQEMQTINDNCRELVEKFEEKKAKILEMKKSTKTGFTSSTWGDNAWADMDTANDVDIDSWPTDNTTTDNELGGEKYRALYEFVARNQDEISFQPGDIIIVRPVQNAEPGWLAGEIRGHTGWFPESYVERIDTNVSATDTFVHQDSAEKRTLEEIAEVPENVSDTGSAVGEAPYVEPITPKSGEGQSCNISAITLYQYRPTKDFHLSFGKGENITIKEQQDVWCYGESSSGNFGWFPKSYIKVETTNGQNTSTSFAVESKEYYISLYQYASTESGDLNFNQGEIVLVIKKEGDWWTGVIGERTGIFPSNYVQKYHPDNQSAEMESIEKSLTGSEEQSDAVTKLETPHEKTFEQMEEERAEAEDQAELPDFTIMSTQQRGRKPEIVQVIASYKATSTEQLDLQKGQLIMIRKKTESGWWEGELQARGKKRQIGWFPASYVKLLISTSNRSTPVSHRYQESPTSDPFSEKVMALYPYKAINEDELSFEKGDVIVVISKDEESWWRGELNSVSGVFPSNYVTPMS